MIKPKEIIIKNQKDLNKIPEGFKGTVIIDSKPRKKKPLLIIDSNLEKVKVIGRSEAELHKRVSVEAYDHSFLILYDYSQAILKDNSYGEFYDKSKGIAKDNSNFFTCEKPCRVKDERKGKKTANSKAKTKTKKTKKAVKKTADKTPSNKTSRKGKNLASASRNTSAGIIAPEYINSILKGKTKLIISSNKTNVDVIYLSGNGKVFGEVNIEKIESGKATSLWQKFGKNSSLKRKDFLEEGDNITIYLFSKVKKYRKPKDIKSFGIQRTSKKLRRIEI